MNSSNAWRAGKIVAAVCHGPAELIGAKDEGGEPLVKGRRVTSFSDSEERAIGLDRTMPFLLESRLRAIGARYECTSRRTQRRDANGRQLNVTSCQSRYHRSLLLPHALKAGS